MGDDWWTFEFNSKCVEYIEKQTENIYRTISQKRISLPSSSQTIKNNVMKDVVRFTPQESEQLSKYVSDDSYVKKQKEDIKELASMFKDMLGKTGAEDEEAYIEVLKEHFAPQEDFKARYQFWLEGRKTPLFVEVNHGKLDIHYGQEENIDVYAKLTPDVMDSIVEGRMTFQRAFMTGEMTAKGNFKILRMLDTMFNFA